MPEYSEVPEDIYEHLVLQQQQITDLTRNLTQITHLFEQQQQDNPTPQMKAVMGRLKFLNTTIEDMQQDWRKRDPREELSELSKKHDNLSSTFALVEERLKEQERTLSTYLSWKYVALNVCTISFLSALLSGLGTQWIVARPIQQQLNAARQENAVLYNHLQRIEKRLGVPKK
jgi:hypothetical protein